MLQVLQARIPAGAVAARLITAIYEAAYRGTTYACLSLLAGFLVSFAERFGQTTPSMNR